MRLERWFTDRLTPEGVRSMPDGCVSPGQNSGGAFRLVVFRRFEHHEILHAVQGVHAVAPVGAERGGIQASRPADQPQDVPVGGTFVMRPEMPRPTGCARSRVSRRYGAKDGSLGLVAPRIRISYSRSSGAHRPAPVGSPPRASWSFSPRDDAQRHIQEIRLAEAEGPVMDNARMLRGRRAIVQLRSRRLRGFWISTPPTAAAPRDVHEPAAAAP